MGSHLRAKCPRKICTCARLSIQQGCSTSKKQRFKGCKGFSRFKGSPSFTISGFRVSKSFEGFRFSTPPKQTTISPRSDKGEEQNYDRDKKTKTQDQRTRTKNGKKKKQQQKNSKRHSVIQSVMCQHVCTKSVCGSQSPTLLKSRIGQQEFDSPVRCHVFGWGVGFGLFLSPIWFCALATSSTFGSHDRSGHAGGGVSAPRHSLVCAVFIHKCSLAHGLSPRILLFCCTFMYGSSFFKLYLAFSVPPSHATLLPSTTHEKSPTEMMPPKPRQSPTAQRYCPPLHLGNNSAKTLHFNARTRSMHDFNTHTFTLSESTVGFTLVQQLHSFKQSVDHTPTEQTTISPRSQCSHNFPRSMQLTSFSDKNEQMCSRCRLSIDIGPHVS